MDSSSDQAGSHSPAGHHTWNQKSKIHHMFYLRCWVHERYKGSKNNWSGLAEWCLKVFSLSVAPWIINWLNSLFILDKDIERWELWKPHAGTEPWQRMSGHREDLILLGNALPLVFGSSSCREQMSQMSLLSWRMAQSVGTAASQEVQQPYHIISCHCFKINLSQPLYVLRSEPNKDKSHVP